MTKERWADCFKVMFAREHCVGAGYWAATVCLANHVNITSLLREFRRLTILSLSRTVAMSVCLVSGSPPCQWIAVCEWTYC